MNAAIGGIAIPGLVFSAVACGLGPEARDPHVPPAIGSNTTATGLVYDVNDVSFLFPLPSDGAGVAAMLSLRSDSDATLYMSHADYLQLVPSGDEEWLVEPIMDSNGNPIGGVPNILYHSEVNKVVAVRVDPCAKDAPDALACRAEFRLVLQPVTWAPDIFVPAGPNIVSTVDSALHLIYRVSEADVPAVYADLAELKGLAGTATTGEPLAVHPVLGSEGMSGPYGSKLLDMIARYAQPDALRVATHMVTEHNSTWLFFKTARQGAGLVRETIPFVNGLVQEVSVTDIQKIEVVNPSTAADNTGVIIDSIQGRPFFQLPTAEQDVYVGAALRIDNPLRHTPATLDCVSCHTATRALNRTRFYDFLNADDGDPNRYPLPVGVTGTLVGMALDNVYSVRAFGYFFDRPSITRGVLNDSARVAAALTLATELAD